MMQLASKTALLTAVFLVVGRASAVPRQVAGEDPSKLPRLTLVLSLDQFRADYLERFGPFFCQDGFRRIFKEGVNCQGSVYRHAKTATGPGHAVIGTGAYPHRSGIVGNTWRDRKTLKQVYCVAGPKGASPEHLLVRTLAEHWKKRFPARSRILSISFKDRAAVLMAGGGGDGVFWFDGVVGRLRSSPWYDSRPATPARTAFKTWVAALAKGGQDGRLIDVALGATWNELPCPSKDPTLQKAWSQLEPDTRQGESARNGWQPQFPRQFDKSRGPRYYAQVTESPWGDRFLIDCLLSAIDSKDVRLGRRDGAVDLALVSLSSLDYIGHAHGPWSHEVRDEMIRLDRRLASLFRSLDERIGKDAWTLAMTGDHGVANSQERSRRLGQDAGIVSQYRPRKDAGLVRARLGDFLLHRFADRFRKGFVKTATDGLGTGLVDGLCLLDDGSLYIRPDLERVSGIRPSALLDAVQEFFSKEPYVLQSLRRRDLGQAKEGIPWLAAQSFHPDRSGDLILILKPNWFWQWGRGGATHGSPHVYDRAVPLLFLGRGFASGRVVPGAGIDDLVPTLAKILGIPTSPIWDGQPLQKALAGDPPR